MALSKNPKVTPVKVPVSNINTYVRIPGYPPYPLGRALQDWTGVFAREQEVRDGDTNTETRLVREVVFETPEGFFSVPVNELVYETALYTLAARRFGLWMQKNKDQVQATTTGAR